MTGSHLKRLLMKDCFVVCSCSFVADCIAVFARASLISSLDRNWSSKNVLVRLSWPVLLMYALCVEEL